MAPPSATLTREPPAPYTRGMGSPAAVSSSFRPAVRRWFGESFEAPTRAQALGWPSIVAGESTLLLAPTGSGKTLAAFLAGLDRVMFAPEPTKTERFERRDVEQP
jgi:ATP-dependent helicase Lhr and Lhr-like helicase